MTLHQVWNYEVLKVYKEIVEGGPERGLNHNSNYIDDVDEHGDEEQKIQEGWQGDRHCNTF